jgi:hypothetical protein
VSLLLWSQRASPATLRDPVFLVPAKRCSGDLPQHTPAIFLAVAVIFLRYAFVGHRMTISSGWDCAEVGMRLIRKHCPGFRVCTVLRRNIRCNCFIDSKTRCHFKYGFVAQPKTLHATQVLYQGLSACSTPSPSKDRLRPLVTFGWG